MWTEPILHVDMDAFYVEVERLDNPALKGLPVAVGGTGPRGVIASASYEARGHGVTSAQPTSRATRLCPGLVVVPPSHGKYTDASLRVFELFRSYTPMVEGLSLDEAFLDVSGLRLHYDSPVEVAEAIRTSIRSETGLPSSVGVAASKLVAKLASEEAKPDGMRHIPADAQLEFLHGLDVTRLWGVGPATAAGLTRLGVATVGELAELPEAVVKRALGPTVGAHLLRLASGTDPRPVEPDSEAKSISVEQTFPRDLSDEDLLETVLLAQSQQLSGRLHRSGLAARTVSIKLRYRDFTTVTRSETLLQPIDDTRSLFVTVGALFRALDLTQPVRLLGVGASSLQPIETARQMTLDTDSDRARLSTALEEVRSRFGDGAVEPARLLDMFEEEVESHR